MTKTTVIFLTFISTSVFAQTQIKDTAKVDSTQLEIIQKMPMDTSHHDDASPIFPSADTLMYKRTQDDADPKTNPKK